MAATFTGVCEITNQLTLNNALNTVQ